MKHTCVAPVNAPQMIVSATLQVVAMLGLTTFEPNFTADTYRPSMTWTPPLGLGAGQMMRKDI